MDNNIESFLLTAIEGMRSDVQKMAAGVAEMGVQIKALSQAQDAIKGHGDRLTALETRSESAEKWQERSTNNVRSMITICTSVIVVCLGIATMLLAHWK